jgi:hypothetical protein
VPFDLVTIMKAALTVTMFVLEFSGQMLRQAASIIHLYQLIKVLPQPI